MSALSDQSDPGRPRLLDLFCGAGGAAMGYHRAGFDVVGVDIEPQPRYPFPFIQADALMIGYRGFDAVHASPPCQAHTALAVMPNAHDHPDLVAATRDQLAASGVPYVIENVVGAPLRNPVQICGAGLGLGTETHDLARHRLFECSFPLLVPPCAHRSRKVIGIYGDHARTDRRHHAHSQYDAADSLRYGGEAMGIDWMIWPELAQAIPPAYTEHVGGYLMRAVAPAMKLVDVDALPADAPRCPTCDIPAALVPAAGCGEQPCPIAEPE